MADNPFDFKKLMEQTQNMQKKWQEIQENLAKIEVIGESGAGLVKITMNNQGVSKIQIDEELLAENKCVLEELVAAAVNDALQKKEKASQTSLTSMAKNFNVTV
jgi:DNA-binding YbaB/EbfC family protein